MEISLRKRLQVQAEKIIKDPLISDGKFSDELRLVIEEWSAETGEVVDTEEVLNNFFIWYAAQPLPRMRSASRTD